MTVTCGDVLLCTGNSALEMPCSILALSVAVNGNKLAPVTNKYDVKFNGCAAAVDNGGGPTTGAKINPSLMGVSMTSGCVCWGAGLGDACRGGSAGSAVGGSALGAS